MPSLACELWLRGWEFRHGIRMASSAYSKASLVFRKMARQLGMTLSLTGALLMTEPPGHFLPLREKATL